MPIFDDTQELRLQHRRKLTDLIEKNGASSGELQLARFRRRGAGERASLVAEELTLDERRRNGRQVDLDHRQRGSLTPEVKRMGSDVFSGAGFPAEENVTVGAGEPLQKLDHFHHLRIYCDDGRVNSRSGSPDVYFRHRLVVDVSRGISWPRRVSPRHPRAVPDHSSPGLWS